MLLPDGCPPCRPESLDNKYPKDMALTKSKKGKFFEVTCFCGGLVRGKFEKRQKKRLRNAPES